MLHNWNHICSSYYSIIHMYFSYYNIIKFVDFESIHYVINLNVIIFSKFILYFNRGLDSLN